jgi:GDP-L-fucose synthase
MTELLITGSDGLVGTALRGLSLNGVQCISRKEVDLTNFNDVSNLFLKLQPKKIIHLAAQVGGIGGNLMHSGEYFRNNILINTNVLESARLAGCDRLISYMSTCVFPDKCEYPLNEKSLHNGPPHPSNFGYAYAKRMLEVQSTAYRKEWGCNYVVAIPTNIYGPGDNFNLTEGHVVPALIHRMFLAKQNNADLEVWGTGKPLREFVYSADIAKLSIWAINNYQEETPIIFTSGIESSIRELVEMVAKVMKFRGKIIFNEDKPDGQFRKPSDGTKLKSYLPNFHWTPLDEGIELTVDWFLSNYQTLRK